MSVFHGSDTEDDFHGCTQLHCFHGSDTEDDFHGCTQLHCHCAGLCHPLLLYPAFSGVWMERVSRGLGFLETR